MARILVVDDNDKVRMMLRMTLESEGYEVSEAPDGDVAIQLFQETPVDLVITDIVMPEKEGIETIMELRRIAPELKIIAISGGGRIRPENYLYTAQVCGANKTFVKPIDQSVLLDTIRDLIGT